MNSSDQLGVQCVLDLPRFRGRASAWDLSCGPGPGSARCSTHKKELHKKRTSSPKVRSLRAAAPHRALRALSRARSRRRDPIADPQKEHPPARPDARPRFTGPPPSRKKNIRKKNNRRPARRHSAKRTPAGPSARGRAPARADDATRGHQAGLSCSFGAIALHARGGFSKPRRPIKREKRKFS